MQITITSILTAATALASVVSAAPKGKAFDRYIQIWFENQDYDTIASTSGFTDLLSQGILLDNYNALTHPSQPNYVSIAGGTNYGVNSDSFFNIPASVKTIFDLLENKGLTWKLYQEDIPSTGYTGAKSGEYVRKHNPAISYQSISKNATRTKNIVSADQFTKDLASGNLPNWMFYTPNLENDGHDTGADYAGKWLSDFYSNTLNNPALLNDNTLILLTFDETESYSSRNRVWSLLLGGAIPSSLQDTTDSTFYTHYSSLSTVEHNWGLGNLGQQDVNPTVSNVYAFAADALGYTNVDVPEDQIPLNNEPFN